MTKSCLRSPHWPNVFLALYVALIALLLFAVPAHAAPSFSVADVTCPEAGPCAVTVRKSAAAKSWSRVTLSTADGTAHAPGDYAATSVTLTFGNNQLAQTVSLPIVNDNAAEGSESFTVRLAAVRNAAIARGVATVTIADDDVAPAPPPTPVPVPPGSWIAAPLTVGGYAKALALEQAVPKDSPYAYGEGLYRTVQAGEVVRLGVRVPDVACACTGQRSEWAVSDLDGRFIGYLWEANLSGVAPAP